MKKLAFFTSNDPQTISYNFSKILLPALKSKFDLTVFTNDFQDFSDFKTYHYLKAHPMHRKNAFDLFVYQVENHESCYFARTHLGLCPGMVIFHHLNFLDFGPEPILNSAWQLLLDQFIASKDEWPARGEDFPQAGPLGYRESAWSLIPVFTNPVNVSEFNKCVEQSISKHYNVEPNYLPYPVRELEVAQPTKDFVIASAANFGVSERIRNLFLAAKNIPELHLKLLIEKSEEAKAKDLINDYDLENKVSLHFGRTAKNWEKILDGASLASHLMFSVYEQPCPFLPISMAKSVPVICSDYGFSEILPDSVVFKISPGVEESQVLIETIKKIKDLDLSSVGSETKAFAQDHFNLDLVASEFKSIIENNNSVIKAFNSDWKQFQQKAKKSLVAEHWNESFEDVYQELGWL